MDNKGKNCMKKICLILILTAIHLTGYAQSKQTYIYNIVTMNQSLTSKKYSVNVDDGIKNTPLKNNEGKTIKFKTPAAIVNYFLSKGWELISIGNDISGSGSAVSSVTLTHHYMIIRKPCTKEELEATIQQGTE